MLEFMCKRVTEYCMQFNRQKRVKLTWRRGGGGGGALAVAMVTERLTKSRSISLFSNKNKELKKGERNILGSVNISFV